MENSRIEIDKTKMKAVFISLWNIVSQHYVVMSSMLISIFSILCYLHAQSVFGEFGLNFLHFASLSDIYSIAISSGVVSATLAKALLLSSVLLLIISIPRIRQYFVSKGRFYKVLWVVIVVAFLFILQLIGQKQKEIMMARSLFQPADVKQARYQLITSDDREGRGCVGLLAGTSTNLITWNYQSSQIEIIPKSRVIRVDLAVRAPLHYVPNFRRKNQSSEERLQELIWILNNHNEWTALLKLKCAENIAVDPMLGQEIKRLQG
ncbi:hypothetical protein GQ852_18365 [Vibrio parahaemolyticus]|nr:hypothetical protein [Vibrio parahaemolyticus]